MELSFCNISYILLGISSFSARNNFLARKQRIEKYFSGIVGCKVSFEAEIKKIVDAESERLTKAAKENIVKYLLLIKGPFLKDTDSGYENLGDFFQLHHLLRENKEDLFLKSLRPYLANKDKIDAMIRTSELSADMNIFMQLILHNGMQKAMREILKCFYVDINSLTRVHKNQQPYRLVCYLAEKGYHDLIKIAVASKDLQVFIKENEDKFTSVFQACVFGQSYYKNVKNYRKEFTTNFEICIDLIIGHEDFKRVIKEQEPMVDVMRYNYDYAALKLIEKFGLRCEFIDEINEKILKNFLNAQVKIVDCDTVEVNYEFLAEDDENKSLLKLKNSELSTLIKHPVLAAYIELKSGRFRSSQRWNFFAFLVFFVGLSFLGFLLKSFNVHEVWSATCLGIACLYLATREGFQIYFIWEDVKRDYDFTSILILKETLTLYISALSNVAEVFLIFFTALSTVTVLLDWDHLFRIAFSLTILLGALELSFLLTAAFSSSFGIYFFMLKNVSITFGRIIIFFFIIILAFGFAFHVVFHDAGDDSEADDATDKYRVRR